MWHNQGGSDGIAEKLYELILRKVTGSEEKTRDSPTAKKKERR